MTTHDEKMKAIALAKASLDKKYGKGSLYMGEGDIVKVDAISTGCTMLDAAIGVGGFPKGRISEIFGDEATGKTTLGLGAVANCQAAGGVAAYVDAEHGLDPPYTQALGVKWHDMLISQPHSAEEALETVRILVSSGGIDMIVVDSVSALTPLAEITGEVGDYHVGLHARLMGQALRMLPGVVAKTNTALIFINQMRSTIASYGPTKTTSGGRALRYAAALRIELARVEQLQTTQKEKYGNKIKANIVKNKVAAPYKTVEYHLVNGVGVDDWATTLDYAKKYALVAAKGAGYYYFIDTTTGEIADKPFAQGQDKAVAFLKTSDEGKKLKENVVEAYHRSQRENNLIGDDS